MRLLLLTHFFPPDLSAGSFRMDGLVRALRAAAPHVELDVLTAQPNRYKSFALEAPREETDGGFRLRRIPLPLHRSGIRDQAHTFLTFARGALAATRGDRYDLVFATSSRLMTAALGALLARRAHARLYLDLRDIFVDTIGDVLPRRTAAVAAPAFSLLERATVTRADTVNLVSRGFAPYFTARYPRTRFTWFTNGIDDEFLPLAAHPLPGAEGAELSVVYAGNIGEGQGLESIVPALARRLAGRARFTIIGDGGRRTALERELAAHDVVSVTLLPPIARSALVEAYAGADVLFLHLNDYPAFRKVLPSKLFEYGASGRPILAGVAGHAAEFVRAELPNAALFAPLDLEGAVHAFDSLRIERTPREAFVQRFSRPAISAALAADILARAAR